MNRQFFHTLLVTLSLGFCVAPLMAANAVLPMAAPVLEQVSPLVAEVVRERYQQTLAAPGSARSWGGYGMALLANKLQDDDAIMALMNAHRLDPRELKWLLLLTLALNDHSDERALVYAGKGVALDAGSADAQYVAAMVYEAQGDLVRAAAALGKAVEIKPDQYALNYLAGQVLFTLKRYDESQKYLLKAMQAAPTSARVRAALLGLSHHIKMAPGLIPTAAAASDQREITYAPALFAEVAELSREPAALGVRARQSLQQRNWAEARQAFAWLDEYYDLNSSGRMDYGLVLTALGDYAAAEKQYRRLLAMEPKNQHAMLALADLLFMNRNPDAGPLYNTLFTTTKDNNIKAEALQGLGRMAAANGNLDEALKRLKGALKLNSQSADFHFDLVRIYADLKNFAVARYHLQQAQRLGMTVDPRFKQMLDQAESHYQRQ